MPTRSMQIEQLKFFSISVVVSWSIQMTMSVDHSLHMIRSQPNSATEINSRLIPKLKQLHTTLQEKTPEFSDIVKIGHTNTQDATPLTLGQEFRCYTTQVKYGLIVSYALSLACISLLKVALL